MCVLQELIPNMEESEDINFKLCINDRDFLPGTLITTNINEHMTQSNVLMFVVTRSFIASRWCAYELDMAQIQLLDQKVIKVIIIFLENLSKNELPKSLRRLAKHVTHIMWTNTPRGKDLFWKKLKLAMNTNI